MSILNIPYKEAIVLLEEIPTDGNSPIKVITDDYECYVAKNSKNKTPSTDIINEVICSCFLKLWDIPVPDFAFVKIQPQKIRNQYSSSHKPNYYIKPVFGSKWLNKAVDINLILADSNKKGLNLVSNPLDLFKIGLFDIWIENDDRKNTNYNLLLNPIDELLEITAIDHSFVFSTMNYKDLNPSLFCPIENDNLLVSEFAKVLKKYKTSNRTNCTNDYKNFYICVQKCEKHFLEIIEQIPVEWGFTEEHSICLRNFLFNKIRNKEVFYDYIRKVY